MWRTKMESLTAQRMDNSMSVFVCVNTLIVLFSGYTGEQSALISFVYTDTFEENSRNKWNQSETKYFLRKSKKNETE